MENEEEIRAIIRQGIKDSWEMGVTVTEIEDQIIKQIKEL